jgi:hypothetical protein
MNIKRWWPVPRGNGLTLQYFGGAQSFLDRFGPAVVALTYPNFAKNTPRGRKGEPRVPEDTLPGLRPAASKRRRLELPLAHAVLHAPGPTFDVLCGASDCRPCRIGNPPRLPDRVIDGRAEDLSALSGELAPGRALATASTGRAEFGVGEHLRATVPAKHVITSRVHPPGDS